MKAVIAVLVIGFSYPTEEFHPEPIRFAEKAHAEIAILSIGSAGIGAGAITVSIGLAVVIPSEADSTSMMALYRFADAALYEAKAGGRNQTRCARSQGTASVPQRPQLLIMGSA